LSKSEYKLAVRAALLEYARKSAQALVQDVTRRPADKITHNQRKKRSGKTANPLQLTFSLDEDALGFTPKKKYLL